MTIIPTNEIIAPFIESHKKLFAKIATSTPTLDGWTSVEKALTLASLVLQTKPSLIYEVGVFSGRSLLPMAYACQVLNRGKVVGIDPYDAQVSARNEFPDTAAWWASVDHVAIMNKFLALVKMNNLESYVELIRKSSDHVEPAEGIGIFHCDGSHTEQAVRDAERFCPKVIIGGYVIFDDLNWTNGGVLRAVDTAEEIGFEEVFRLVKDSDCWNVMKRIK